MQFESLFDIQKNMASRLSREVELDRAIELMSIIQSLVPDKSGKIAIDSIILEASYSNFSENEVLNFLDILKRNGSIKLLEGFVKI
ncbi:MAG: hypothetical protein PHU51_03520 [Candidatus Nanoarchaeia archaeon]|jgi:hypothetical protein|nr:hypothetical protein [Candidatus Nanoarchaeia archaeon]